MIARFTSHSNNSLCLESVNDLFSNFPSPCACINEKNMDKISAEQKEDTHMQEDFALVEDHQFHISRRQNHGASKQNTVFKVTVA